MSESTARITLAREETASQPRVRHTSATLNHLGSSAPLEEYERLGAEIAEDVAKLQAKIATKNTLETHLRLAGQIV